MSRFVTHDDDGIAPPLSGPRRIRKRAGGAQSIAGGRTVVHFLQSAWQRLARTEGRRAIEISQPMNQP